MTRRRSTAVRSTQRIMCKISHIRRLVPITCRAWYAHTTLTNTATTQLYRMPQTAEGYAVGGLNDQLHTDARAAAAADYDVESYDRVVVLFSWLGDLPDSQITYGGLGEVGAPHAWINGEFDFRVVAHELGHTYGLLHANLWQVTDGNPISTSGTSAGTGTTSIRWARISPTIRALILIPGLRIVWIGFPMLKFKQLRPAVFIGSTASTTVTALEFSA